LLVTRLEKLCKNVTRNHDRIRFDLTYRVFCGLFAQSPIESNRNPIRESTKVKTRKKRQKRKLGGRAHGFCFFDFVLKSELVAATWVQLAVAFKLLRNPRGVVETGGVWKTPVT
jgi:hypothetical protein